MQENIISKVKQALVSVLKIAPQQELLPTTQLKEDLGLDSMSSLTFLMALEDLIEGFVINPETLDVDHLHTIQTISNYVQKELDVETYATEAEEDYA